MKTISLGLVIIFLSIVFSGCEKDDIRVVPSDQISTRTHTITAFEELNISDPFQVYISFSTTGQELQIEANDNLHSFIEVKQDGEELSIKLDDDVNLTDGTAVLKVYLTTNDIRKIEAQGAAKVYLQDHWYEDHAEVELTGASSLEGALTSSKLTADLTGASNLIIEGSTEDFDLEATGASNMSGFDFATNKFKADLTGGCRVELTVHEELRVKASGASEVRYRGNGVVQSQDLSGGSVIIRE